MRATGALTARLRQLGAGRAGQVRLYEPELQIFAGYEERGHRAPYRWDGMRRGAPQRPALVFQYTLAGAACCRMQAGDRFFGGAAPPNLPGREGRRWQ